MGTSLSIDKHVSSLDDILEMPPSYFDKIKFESKISPDITQHLKVISSLYISHLILIIQLNRYGDSLRTNENLKMSRVILSC